MVWYGMLCSKPVPSRKQSEKQAVTICYHRRSNNVTKRHSSSSITPYLVSLRDHATSALVEQTIVRFNTGSHRNDFSLLLSKASFHHRDGQHVPGRSVHGEVHPVIEVPARRHMWRKGNHNHVIALALCALTVKQRTGRAEPIGAVGSTYWFFAIS